MAIQFTCLTCGSTLNLRDSMAGKKGKCPQCGTVLTVPQAQPATAPPPTPTAPPPAQKAPGAEAPAEGGGPFVHRTIALLTAGAPQIDPAQVKARIAKWTGLSFPEGGDAVENFLVGEETHYIAKLAGVYLYMIALVDGAFFDSEDLPLYELQAVQSGTEEAFANMQACNGAVVIDAHVTGGVQSTIYLAKLAAACVGTDTAAVVVPPSLKASPLDRPLFDALAGENDPSKLMPRLANFVVLPDRASGGFLCMALGLALFDLPDVVMRCTESQVEQASAAVQSVAMYQVTCAKAMPIGDTMTIPGLGDLRATAPPAGFEDMGEFGSVWLQRKE